MTGRVAVQGVTYAHEPDGSLTVYTYVELGEDGEPRAVYDPGRPRRYVLAGEEDA